ncbi:MAG: cell surface protein SprA [Kaistia sp. SCN 65-12]|nr:MAG: cell surface protein SprA [Kaistia sp. SCN 65-12]
MISTEKGKRDTVKHNLNTQSFKVVAVNKNGRPVEFRMNKLSPSSAVITGIEQSDSVSVTFTTFDPNIRTVPQQIGDITTRMLMMVRRVSFTYRETSSMVLPGLLPTPRFLGQRTDANGLMAPGLGFAFGLHDASTIPTAIENGWLFMSDSIINPATTARTTDFDMKASLEPLPGLKIELNAKRYQASNTTVQYMFDGMPTTFTGSYNITLITLATAFKPIATAENNYYSEVFDRFMSNRQLVADRLNRTYVDTNNYPGTGFMSDNPLKNKPFDPSLGQFGLNSTEVLIPSFLAAYSGKDVNKVESNPFPSLKHILPNWRLTYDGLSRIPWIQSKFRSISISHGYTSRYSVGSYTSYSTWVAMADGSQLGYIRDVQSNNPIPSAPFDIASVTLNEQFVPLIGMNATLKNSMTAKLEYKKQRNLTLNLSSTQLIDATSDEFVVGVGYVVKDFDVILKLKNDTQSRIKNDLKLNADLSYKDIKSLLRKIDENLTQASSGNKLLTVKIIADYVFSSKVNIQAFYDRQISKPLISSSYPVSATNFGVSFKFMLTR